MPAPASSPVSISFLADHPEFLESVAAAMKTWRSHHLPGWTLEDFSHYHRKSMQTDRLPLGMVAHENGRFLGYVRLVEDDLPSRPQYMPWLASLFVSPDQRGRGLGRLLVQAAESQAAKMGFERLYLFNRNIPEFYLKAGWTPFDEADFNGKNYTVYSKSLTR